MTTEQDQISNDILGYLEQHQQKELLRFVSVGSVDDGKSTLIGRLLHDTHGIYEDQLSAVKRASGRAGMEIDFSLFTDGLKAEREQGITIDVAYRYFSTAKRKFIIADTPGHVQYTRNMATGASTANVAIILIDARLGVLQQSRRHAYIASLLGIPHLFVGINKMDLVSYSQDVFNRIREEFAAFLAPLGFKGVRFIPMSALKGDNVVHRSDSMPWYDGNTLLEHLESVPIASDRNHDDFRYPVQYVLRPDLNYRGFSGAIASGVVKKGDQVMVLPSRRTSTVVAIDTFDGEKEQAFAPMSVTLRLADEIDISRGDMLVHPDNLPHVAQRFETMLVWLSERALDRQKSYLLKHTTQMVRANVEHVAYTTDLETLKQTPADAPRAERHRPRHAHLPSSDLLRRLQEEPRHRRVHPDRLADQQHGRRRHDPGGRSGRARVRRRRPELARSPAQPGQPGRTQRTPRAKGRHAVAHWLARFRQDRDRLRARAPAVRSKALGLRDRPGRRSVARRLARRLEPRADAGARAPRHGRGPARDLRLRLAAARRSRNHPRRRGRRALRRNPRRDLARAAQEARSARRVRPRSPKAQRRSARTRPISSSRSTARTPKKSRSASSRCW